MLDIKDTFQWWLLFLLHTLLFPLFIIFYGIVLYIEEVKIFILSYPDEEK